MRLQKECVALQEAADARSDHGMMLYLLAALHLERGDLDQAERTAEQAQAFVERNAEESVARLGARAYRSCAR